MDVSIIIINWNTRELLLQCLHSIYANKSPLTIEVIVADNCSTDGSVPAVRQAYPAVIMIENSTNLGYAKACNTGIKASKGDFICIANSDIIIRNGCIERLHAFMHSHPSAGMTGPRVLYPDLRIQRSCKRFPSLWNNFCAAFGLCNLFGSWDFFQGEHISAAKHDAIRKVDVIGGAFWMIRRGALDDVGLLDEDFFFYREDVDWCRRFWNAGWEVVFCPAAEIIHHHGASSRAKPIKLYIHQRRANLHYWKKHHGRFSFIPFYVIMLLHQILRVAPGLLLYAVLSRRRAELRFRIKRSLACIGWLLGLIKIEKP